MEYALIFILQLFGIGFHAGQKVLELDKLVPDDSLWDVGRLFWKEDKITLIISIFLILPLSLVLYYILLEYGPDSISEYEYFDLIYFGFALVLGYAGQRIIYGALGKAVTFAEKKISDKIQ